ncbi:MAG: Gfo/Idh/MocA family oxidoreductase [Solobacterium sp.]|nr:Gfo/Idh/MocA family oxidoreductase [Solobacterium sp.]
MNEVVLGTIGSGVIVHSILDNVKRTDGVRLGAVYSRTVEKGTALAEEYGCNKVYTDLSEFLADEELNTIYIATPNLVHYGQVKQALTAGKHVWCEKPFCTRPEEAEELLSLAKEKNLMIVETAPTTFLPNYRILQEQLPKIGRIRLVLASYSQYSSRYDLLKAGEVPNIFNPEFAGGALMDINLYNVLLTVALFGQPDEVKYHANIYPSVQCDTSGVGVLDYPDFKAVLSGAKDTWGENFYQIQGEEGYIYINGANGLPSIKVVTKKTEDVFNLQEDPDRWYYEIQELTRLFREEDRDAINARHEIIINTVTTMAALRASAGIRFPKD